MVEERQTHTVRPPWNVEGMRVLVVGAARTGRAAARLLVRLGAKVWLVDKASESCFPGLREELEPLGIMLEFGPHREEPFSWAQGIVVSPGVPPQMELMKEARARGVPIVGELEMASWYLGCPMVAVTGTNGKTTTTTLVGMALESWGKRVFVGGNIGWPLSLAMQLAQRPQVAVVEVSSYQLEGIESFRPKAAALLNITEDHLDRHPTMEEYRRTKALVFSNQGKGDVAVVNLDDPEAMAAVPAKPSMEVWGFSLAPDSDGMASIRDGLMQLKVLGKLHTFELERTWLKGPHGAQNAMAAALCSCAMGCAVEVVFKALEEFRGLEHRMERVGEIAGVSFVNDSKATNVGAAVPAIMGADGKVVWIGGGKDKGIDFSKLRGPLREKARAAVLLGEAARRMEEALRGVVPVHLVRDMEEAVPLAFTLAVAGDTVLLSPACSSFDQYRDYEERGAHFKEIVSKLVSQTQNR